MVLESIFPPQSDLFQLLSVSFTALISRRCTVQGWSKPSVLYYEAYYHEVSEEDEDMMTEVQSAPSQQHRSIKFFLFFLSELTIIHFYFQKQLLRHAKTDLQHWIRSFFDCSPHRCSAFLLPQVHLFSQNETNKQQQQNTK